MAIWACNYGGQRKRKIILGGEIAIGGEGKIFKIKGNESLCAKIYHNQQKGSYEKIIAMLKNKPEDPMRSNHISLAWPEELLLDDQNFLGFTMPFIKDSIHISRVYCPDDRLRNPLWGNFNWRYLFTAARNLASATSAIHEKGHVIGDVNERNVLVSPNAIVTFIDCDSFYIRDGNNFYGSDVGVPEYSAPEIMKTGSYRYRDQYSDMFGIPILIFKLLMLGFHPFSGKYLGKGESPTPAQNIEAGRTPYFRSCYFLRIKPISPPKHILPDKLFSLFERAFVEGYDSPEKRSTAIEWFETLKALTYKLESCSTYRKCKNPYHFYFPHLSSCPWCNYFKVTGRDVFPPIGETQIKAGFQVKIVFQTITCWNCDSENNRNLIYCEKCEVDLCQKYHKCPSCRSSMPINSIFCRMCGRKI